MNIVVFICKCIYNLSFTNSFNIYLSVYLSFSYHKFHLLLPCVGSSVSAIRLALSSALVLWHNTRVNLSFHIESLISLKYFINVVGWGGVDVKTVYWELNVPRPFILYRLPSCTLPNLKILVYSPMSGRVSCHRVGLTFKRVVVGYPHKYCATIIAGHQADTSPFVDWRVHSCAGVSLSLPVACRLPPRSMDFSKQWWRLCLFTTLTSFMFKEICSYSLQKQGFTIILWKATNSFSNGLSYMRSIEFKLGYINLD